MKRWFLVLALFILILSACGGLTAGGSTAGGTPGSTTPPEMTTRDQDGMVMVHVPAGQFTMGSSTAQIEQATLQCSENRPACMVDQFADEGPAHTVTLDAFWMDRTEVSNAKYRRCIEAGACTATSCPDDATLTGDTQPVVCVSWDQASAYCAWAGGRLPTEAEWEYAARGPQGTLYPWSDYFDREAVSFCDVQCPFSWADVETSDGYTTTAPVGSFPRGASWCAALDMAGNTWEWVQDWYAAYPAEPQANPLVPQGGNGRVLRGGSWDLDPVFLRTTTRNWGEPTASSNVTGFRCVAQPER